MKYRRWNKVVRTVNLVVKIVGWNKLKKQITVGFGNEFIDVSYDPHDENIRSAIEKNFGRYNPDDKYTGKVVMRCEICYDEIKRTFTVLEVYSFKVYKW